MFLAQLTRCIGLSEWGKPSVILKSLCLTAPSLAPLCIIPTESCQFRRTETQCLLLVALRALFWTRLVMGLPPQRFSPQCLLFPNTSLRKQSQWWGYQLEPLGSLLFILTSYQRCHFRRPPEICGSSYRFTRAGLDKVSVITAIQPFQSPSSLY